MCVPIIVSFIYQDGLWWIFGAVALSLLLIGAIVHFFKPKNTQIFAKEGFVVVSLSWLLMIITGALPFFFSQEIPSFIDCVFESASGFTTTGASILTNVETLSPSIAFWRCQTSWLGGIGVLVLLLALLPKTEDNMQSMHIFRAEAPGPQVGKLTSKLTSTSRILCVIYFVLTVAEIVLLLFGKLNLFESMTCAMSTAGTGGFYIYNASIGHFNSVYVEMVVATFMLLFGTNFNVFYFIIIGQFIQILKSEELRWYVGIIAFSVFSISLSLSLDTTQLDFGTSFRYAYFQVASLFSTTGFSTTNYDLWPSFAKMLLLFLMVIGASAGSTSGGMKVSRFVILGKTTIKNLRKALNPNAVSSVRFENKPIDDETVSSVVTFFLLYVLIFVMSILVLSFDNCDFMSRVSSSISCLSNIGAGFAQISPIGNYSAFSPISKVWLTLVMIAGRLELFPIIMLFYKRTWQKV